MKKTSILHPVAAAVLGGSVALAGSVLAAKMPAEATPVAAAAAAVASRPSNPDFAAIVRQSGPAVVGITVEGEQRMPRGQGIPPGLEPFFRGMPGFGAPGGSVPMRGQGSGFIVRADGLVLTNAHVVAKAKEVTVKLSDRREFKAKVLGSDEVTDIAVLKIDAKDLPVVQLGDPAALQVGEPVLAIGAPFGLEQTATQGIVSAKGRSLPGDGFVPFIQTDAAVNPGNSGGPLFDGTGRVVGINSQIYSGTGGYQGLSFAIPIDVALKVRDQIVDHGEVRHARLGVSVQDLTQSLAESFGLPKPDGALVASVAPDSAAAKAGLKPGDVITEIDGQPIVQSGELSSRIGLKAPGDTVQLKVARDRKTVNMTAKLGRLEKEQQASSDDAGAGEGGRLGLALAPSPEGEGLLVQRAQGAAARAGVQAGDVLIAVNGKPVKTIDEVRAILERKPKTVALLIERDGQRIFVPAQLG
jgi:serine protease Do